MLPGNLGKTHEAGLVKTFRINSQWELARSPPLKSTFNRFFLSSSWDPLATHWLSPLPLFFRGFLFFLSWQGSSSVFPRRSSPSPGLQDDAQPGQRLPGAGDEDYFTDRCVISVQWMLNEETNEIWDTVACFLPLSYQC